MTAGGDCVLDIRLCRMSGRVAGDRPGAIGPAVSPENIVKIPRIRLQPDASCAAGEPSLQSHVNSSDLLYSLTRIYASRYTTTVESVFEVIAEPTRRAILSLLASSQRSVGEIERRLRMPQPAVSKHLRVLREAGFVEVTVDAQRRLYRLRPEPLQEVDAWLARFRQFWSAHVDALERHLDRVDAPTPTRKTRRHK